MNLSGDSGFCLSDAAIATIDTLAVPARWASDSFRIKTELGRFSSTSTMQLVSSVKDFMRAVVLSNEIEYPMAEL